MSTGAAIAAVVILAAIVASTLLVCRELRAVERRLDVRLTRQGRRLRRLDARLSEYAEATAAAAATPGVSPAATAQREHEALLAGLVSTTLERESLLRELPAPGGRRVRIGIATMRGREEALAQVLTTLAPQADEVFVYLNDDWEQAPEVPGGVPTNVRFFTGVDLGDRGKFAFLDGFSGYYLTCDDDIAYPADYVERMVAALDRHDRAAVVGWHGSIILEDEFVGYYTPGSREVFGFHQDVPADQRVHVLGTGVAGFHTDAIVPRLTDMPQANMSDLWLATLARRLDVPMFVLAHGPDLVGEIPVATSSIFRSSMDDSDSAGLNRRAAATQLVLDQMPWPQVR